MQPRAMQARIVAYNTDSHGSVLEQLVNDGEGQGYSSSSEC